MLALALSQRLSRRDMAIATGLNTSRVDQIIAEVAAAIQAPGLTGSSSRSRI